jgi:hypothetical protein
MYDVQKLNINTSLNNKMLEITWRKKLKKTFRETAGLMRLEGVQKGCKSLAAKRS